MDRERVVDGDSRSEINDNEKFVNAMHSASIVSVRNIGMFAWIEVKQYYGEEIKNILESLDFKILRLCHHRELECRSWL